ncbi:MAG: hypothetical protein M1820_009684 [Bogoriella megaspora]|nr:MAG: hypothetical protein M1820_009684 [Bogoriella megaspora]
MAFNSRFGQALSAISVFFVQTLAYVDKSGDVIIPGASSYNGLNLVPQMGWDNWNAFACDVNSSLLLNTAQAMADYGLRDLGYKYVVLDDCWSIGRNSSGYLEYDPQKFPGGMKSVADSLHAMDMKFGMYSSAGTFTCGRYPGSLGYETEDADLWASWGVDYLKYDNCFNQGQSGTPKLSFDRYNVMSKALNATGRDVYDSIMNILNKMAPITSRSAPGAFNDMDMLEVGNGGQSDSEYVAHFSMWALMSSPLLIGTNVLTLSPANLAIYSNPAVIALNQDPSGGAAVRKWQYFVDPDEYGQGEIALWTRQMNNSDMVFALLNAGNSSRCGSTCPDAVSSQANFSRRSMNTTLYDIFLDAATAGAYKAPLQLEEQFDVWDLWGNRMSDEEAATLINGTAPAIGANSTSVTRYNATAVSYADGLNANNTALYGKKVGTIGPGAQSTFEATIDRHSVGLYRIRQISDNARRKRDEL